MPTWGWPRLDPLPTPKGGERATLRKLVLYVVECGGFGFTAVRNYESKKYPHGESEEAQSDQLGSFREVHKKVIFSLEPRLPSQLYRVNVLNFYLFKRRIGV